MQISITDGIIKQTITNVLLVGETKNDELVIVVKLIDKLIG